MIHIHHFSLTTKTFLPQLIKLTAASVFWLFLILQWHLPLSVFFVNLWWWNPLGWLLKIRNLELNSRDVKFSGKSKNWRISRWSEVRFYSTVSKSFFIHDYVKPSFLLIFGNGVVTFKNKDPWDKPPTWIIRKTPNTVFKFCICDVYKF